MSVHRSLPAITCEAVTLILFRNTHTPKGIILVQTQQSKDLTLLFEGKEELSAMKYKAGKGPRVLTVYLIGLAIATSKLFSFEVTFHCTIFIRACLVCDGAKYRIPRRWLDTENTSFHHLLCPLGLKDQPLPISLSF